MFTKRELETLRSCWVLPTGELWAVPAESHDMNLPDGYYEVTPEYNYNNDEIKQVEQKCFRMSFWWGWDADISQMTIGCKTLTEPQQQIIMYLLASKIITFRKIETIGDNWKHLDEILSNIEQQLKNNHEGIG